MLANVHSGFWTKQTFGDQCVLSCACQCAVDLADQLHVVQEGVESVEVREADQVRSAATCSLAEDKQIMHVGADHHINTFYTFIKQISELKVELMKFTT